MLSKPVINQTFAQTACNLTLSAKPGSGSLAVGQSITQKLFGTLTYGGVGISGATIVFTSGFSFSPTVQTDSSGNYNLYFLAQSGQTYTIQAYYAGGNNHQIASATTTIVMQQQQQQQ